jgi:hypothetical protein
MLAGKVKRLISLVDTRERKKKLALVALIIEM